ncbi:UNVERIFIED_CONTAM: hypothetical protein Sradi_6252600 [Sesamum radiatum]|uniref:Protein kinase domain-containing protein n=1 Tax=Sesamum radiatum TaxID=300843 RepID=A0AAW2KA57_SESRA
MAEIEFQAVLKFLRENGLSECESALMEDVMEKSQLGSSDFAKFFFPMVPPPPPLRIPPTRRPPPPYEFTDGGGGGGSSKDSSDDEFVSLGSSTAEFCSSGDFTNPYGIRASRPASQSSSDRLSQFGTARDYPDFDLQNDLSWYKENDEDYAMPPFFGDRDFDGDPSEDKFVMTVRMGEPVEHELKYSLISEERANILENRRALVTREDLKYEPYKDYYELDEKFQLEKCDEKCEECCNGYSCSAPLCACCSGAGGIYEGDPANYNLENLKVMDLHDYQSGLLGEEHTIETNVSNQRSSTSDCNGGFSSTHDSSNFKKDCQLKEDNHVNFMDDEVIADETHDAEAVIDEEDGAIPDELMIYDNKEDDYEIFNLRIIHRKNRTGFEENKELPIVLNSIIAGRYCVTEFLGSAAFSSVVQAHDLYSGMDVCLKIIKNDKDFFDQSLDEIKLLKFVNKHDPADEHHILRLYDYFYHQEANQLEYIIPEESSLEDHLQISDPEFLDFLRYLLEINPERRPTAREALQHPWLSRSYV